MTDIALSDLLGQTPADLLDKIKTVDGPGSGLVADTAAQLTTTRNVTLSGVVNASSAFDGSADLTLTTSIDDGALTIAKTDGLADELNGKQATITGAASSIVSSNLSASRVAVSDPSGKLAASTVTTGELEHLSGVTSGIQSQIDAKQDAISGAASTVVTADLTAGRVIVANVSGKIAVSSITTVELDYLSGVSSAIQTQLDGKENAITGAASTVTTANLTASRALLANASGKIAVSTVTDVELGYLSGVTSSIQTQLGGKQATLTGAATTIATSNLTASRAVVSDSSGKVAVSTVTSTELGYVSGVTSAIQTQINGKQATLTGAATTIATSNLTANRAVVSDASGKIAISTVTDTEIGHLSGVTSAIQTQLNGKQATITGAASSVATSNLSNSIVVVSDGTGKIASSTVTTTELGYVSGVTSAIQTQLNGKQATITGGATTILSSNLTASRALVSDVNGKVAVSSITDTELGYLSGVTSALQTQLNSKAPLSSPTFIGSPAINGASATQRRLSFQTGGTNRWQFGADSAAESTGAAGSNLVLEAFDDTGVTLGTVLTVNRASRILNFTVAPTLTTTPSQGDNSTKVATTAYVDTGLNTKQATLTGAATSIATSNLTASRAVVSDGSGKVAVSTVTSTELGYLSGVTSAIQTQLNGKQASLGYTAENAANKGAASGYASLDTNSRLPASQFPVLAGDVSTAGGSLSVTIANGAVGLTKMANLAANSIIGNNTGSAATPIALSGTNVTAMLDTFTSALKGLVPASGGGTTNFLRADGTWAAPAGGGGGTTTNALTFNNGGSGAASGSTFNGGAAVTVSYNTIGAAPVNNPTFTGAVNAPTPTTGDNSTLVATTEFVNSAVTNYVDEVVPARFYWYATTTNTAVLHQTGYLVVTGGAAKTVSIGVAAPTGPIEFTFAVHAYGGAVTVDVPAGANVDSAGDGVDVTVPAGRTYVFVHRGSGNWVVVEGKYAVMADRLATARTINGTSFDGSANITITANNPNALTFSNAGSGAASGTTYDGGTARTISYNSIGALASSEKAAANGVAGLDANARLSATHFPALTGDVTTIAGAVGTTIANSAVTLAKMANLAANSIIGNNTGSAATPLALSGTSVTAMLDVFTSSLKGLVPASGGGTTNFLRADGTWAAPAGGGGGGSPAGSSGALQYNNAGAFGGATYASIGPAGCLIIHSSPDTTYPAEGSFKFDVTAMGGRYLPHVRDRASGSTLQPHIGRNKIAMWTSPGGSNTMAVLGAVALTATGTATAASVATTNRHTWMRRTEFLVTTAATTAVAGFRAAANNWAMGTTPDNGGFHFVCQWGPATGVATTTNRAFVGMTGIAAGTAPTDVNPSTLLNLLGMGWDSTDTNIQFMYNAASGTAAKVDLGATLPVPTADRSKVYELMMFVPPGASDAYWSVTDLATFAEQTGTVLASSGKLPAGTTLLAPRGYISAGGTSSVIGIALMQLYIETDY